MKKHNQQLIVSAIRTLYQSIEEWMPAAQPPEQFDSHGNKKTVSADELMPHVFQDLTNRTEETNRIRLSKYMTSLFDVYYVFLNFMSEIETSIDTYTQEHLRIARNIMRLCNTINKLLPPTPVTAAAPNFAIMSLAKLGQQTPIQLYKLTTLTGVADKIAGNTLGSKARPNSCIQITQHPPRMSAVSVDTDSAINAINSRPLRTIQKRPNCLVLLWRSFVAWIKKICCCLSKARSRNRSTFSSKIALSDPKLSIQTDNKSNESLEMMTRTLSPNQEHRSAREVLAI